MGALYGEDMNSYYRDPESPWNPRVPVDITPDAFEPLILDWLKASAGQSGHEIDAKHLGVAEGSGGDYKIDVLNSFRHDLPAFLAPL